MAANSANVVVAAAARAPARGGPRGRPQRLPRRDAAAVERHVQRLAGRCAGVRAVPRGGGDRAGRARSRGGSSRVRGAGGARPCRDARRRRILQGRSGGQAAVLLLRRPHRDSSHADHSRLRRDGLLREPDLQGRNHVGARHGPGRVPAVHRRAAQAARDPDARLPGRHRPGHGCRAAGRIHRLDRACALAGRHPGDGARGATSDGGCAQLPAGIVGGHVQRRRRSGARDDADLRPSQRLDRAHLRGDAEQRAVLPRELARRDVRRRLGERAARAARVRARHGPGAGRASRGRADRRAARPVGGAAGARSTSWRRRRRSRTSSSVSSRTSCARR